MASAAAQDVPSAEPGQCLGTRTASPCGRQVIGSHLWPTFLCEEKGGSLAGRRARRLTSLAVADKRDPAESRPLRRVRGLGLYRPFGQFFLTGDRRVEKSGNAATNNQPTAGCNSKVSTSASSRSSLHG